MTPVYPFQIRRSEDGGRGELLLQLKDGKSAYAVQLSLEQARVLAVEMRGLATDHCPLHHLTLQVARALDASISHVVLHRRGDGDEVGGILRLVGGDGMLDVPTDPAAALALAIHLGLPIFMDGQFSEHPGPRRPAQAVREPTGRTPIPKPFRDVLAGLDISGLESDGPAAGDAASAG